MKKTFLIGFGVAGIIGIVRGVLALQSGVTTPQDHGRGPATPYGAIVIGALFLIAALALGIGGAEKKVHVERDNDGSD